MKTKKNAVSDKRTKAELLDYITSLEKENERLTNERNASANQLENWKRVQGLTGVDDLDASLIAAIKSLMKIADKVRTRF